MFRTEWKGQLQRHFLSLREISSSWNSSIRWVSWFHMNMRPFPVFELHLLTILYTLHKSHKCLFLMHNVPFFRSLTFFNIVVQKCFSLMQPNFILT
jgi:hypothetical protein